LSPKNWLFSGRHHTVLTTNVWDAMQFEETKRNELFVSFSFFVSFLFLRDLTSFSSFFLCLVVSFSWECAKTQLGQLEIGKSSQKMRKNRDSVKQSNSKTVKQ
jgi:hypothetical protein